jgi:hypothetical protein
MLSAMLIREVDAPIWDKTRSWIESDPDAYFFLILDELHLQRGTGGTEVAFLVRLLLHRLGLDSDQNEKKLRILASSASLPSSGIEGERSLDYLWDMFGANGLRGNRDRSVWREAIVSGQQLRPADVSAPPASELVCAVAAIRSTNGELLSPSDAPESWLTVAHVLGVGDQHGNMRQAAEASVEQAGKLLESACKTVDKREVRTRATALGLAAARLFGEGPQGTCPLA